MGAEALDAPEVQHPIYPSPRSVPHTFDFFPGLASSLTKDPTVGGSSTGGTDLHPGLQTSQNHDLNSIYTRTPRNPLSGNGRFFENAPKGAKMPPSALDDQKLTFLQDPAGEKSEITQTD